MSIKNARYIQNTLKFIQRYYTKMKTNFPNQKVEQQLSCLHRRR